MTIRVVRVLEICVLVVGLDGLSRCISCVPSYDKDLLGECEVIFDTVIIVYKWHHEVRQMQTISSCSRAIISATKRRVVDRIDCS